MFALGGFAVALGFVAVVAALFVWVLTRYEDIARQALLYGTAALLFGLVPVLVLGPEPDADADAANATTVAEADGSSETPKPPKPKADLKLNSWRCFSEYGYQEIAGQVTNVSGKPLDNVLAVATFTDGSDQVIKTASALIEFQPLMPGQTSPFSILTTGNPLIRKCFVQMKLFFGGGLRVES